MWVHVCFHHWIRTRWSTGTAKVTAFLTLVSENKSLLYIEGHQQCFTNLVTCINVSKLCVVENILIYRVIFIAYI